MADTKKALERVLFSFAGNVFSSGIRAMVRSLVVGIKVRVLLLVEFEGGARALALFLMGLVGFMGAFLSKFGCF